MKIGDVMVIDRRPPVYGRPKGWYARLSGTESGLGLGPFGTRAEAQAGLLERLRRTARLADEPALLVTARPGVQALVDRTADAWFYCLYQDGIPGGKCMAWETRREAEIAARRHLAQLVFDDDSGEGGMAVIHPDDKEGRWQHARWAVWQRTYAAAKAEGLDDRACRERADRV